MEENISAQKKVRVLNKEVSRLRSVIYIAVAILILMTALFVFWQYDPANDVPFETYFSQAPEKPVAYLYLSPQEGNYNVGDKISVDILMNTAGSDAVAAAAFLSYDKNTLYAESVDTSASVFTIPFYTAIKSQEGKIEINLAKPTPGVKTYSGNNVKIATVHFKAIAPTNPKVANISFDFTKGSTSYSQVILDDKKGTNILDATRGSKLIIN